MTTSNPTMLSGISPSGRLTLGNYLGAIRNWVGAQGQFECFFPLVDLHAITVRQNPETFADRCLDFIAQYIACGIDPTENAIFVQSHVPEHSELAWILNCYAQTGELNRMTQYKDKSRRNVENMNAGLFGYPVLMAADILLYQATHVPVGEDQKQHLELTRDVAGRFNNLYGPVFTIPEPLIPAVGARVMSLQNPTRKMSKSDEVEGNLIVLLDSPDVISRKFKRAVTDSGNEIVQRVDKPGIANLLNIASATMNVSIDSLEERYRGKGYGQLKSDVADAVIALLEPVRQRYEEVRSDKNGLEDILAVGSEKARAKAAKTLTEVHRVLGLIPATSRDRTLDNGY
ncbi:MAG: tryptophan--tRNA ligase [Gammaproteobacteria bacterium]|nr:tryptophan--tRNA ligase [Gammaproteobacteria bacterium]